MKLLCVSTRMPLSRFAHAISASPIGSTPSCVAFGIDSLPAFSQRAIAPCRAISDRSSLGNAFALALPPLAPSSCIGLLSSISQLLGVLAGDGIALPKNKPMLTAKKKQDA